MHSSRSAPQLMTVEQMYSVVRGETGSWGIDGYEVAKKYIDPLRQIKEREYAKQEKGKKSTKLVTKRGHFLDDLAKSRNYNKAPVQYNVEYKWVSEKDKEKKPRSAPTKRMTYIDEIYRDNTKEKPLRRESHHRDQGQEVEGVRQKEAQPRPAPGLPPGLRVPWRNARRPRPIQPTPHPAQNQAQSPEAQGCHRPPKEAAGTHRLHPEALPPSGHARLQALPRRLRHLRQVASAGLRQSQAGGKQDQILGQPPRPQEETGKEQEQHERAAVQPDRLLAWEGRRQGQGEVQLDEQSDKGSPKVDLLLNVLWQSICSIMHSPYRTPLLPPQPAACSTTLITHNYIPTPFHIKFIYILNEIVVFSAPQAPLLPRIAPPSRRQRRHEEAPRNGLQHRQRNSAGQLRRRARPQHPQGGEGQNEAVPHLPLRPCGQDENDFPKYISYYIDLKKIPPMYLDALLYIKDNYDSSLSLRRSCREGICGSCSMNCDGLHKLACIHAIDTDLSQPAIVTPLGHMFVVKDLVVDMTNFYTQYKTIDPYLKRKTPKTGTKEYLQSPEDRQLLDGLYECVLCACCSTSCPSYWWHPDRYLGPAVLMQAYRWIVDSRDEYTDERLEKLAEDIKVDDCQNIGMCSTTCPKGLDPQKSVQHLMHLVEEFKARKIAEATI